MFVAFEAASDVILRDTIWWLAHDLPRVPPSLQRHYVTGTVWLVGHHDSESAFGQHARAASGAQEFAHSTSSTSASAKQRLLERLRHIQQESATVTQPPDGVSADQPSQAAPQDANVQMHSSPEVAQGSAARALELQRQWQDDERTYSHVHAAASKDQLREAPFEDLGAATQLLWYADLM